MARIDFEGRLGTASTAATRARAAVHGDRILSAVEGAALFAQAVVDRARADFPTAFDSRRDRRAGDRNSGAPGLEVTEHIGTDEVITGNADIAISERGTSTPKNEYTLPIYPTPHDLAEIRTRTEGQP